MGEWISVKESLPDLNDKYLVTIEYMDRRVIEIVRFAKDLSKVDHCAFTCDTGSGWYVYDSEYGHYAINNIIAWQSLPSPYKGGVNQMTKTYCDCCGKEFDKWHQTVKHEIRIKDKEKGWFRDLDICDECRKDIESFIDKQLGIKDVPHCSTCKFHERPFVESPCCNCDTNNNQWEGKADDNR